PPDGEETYAEEIDESDSLVNSIPLPGCPGCTMVKNEWPGEGYTHDGETYCCQGCAEGTGCICVAVETPGFSRRGQKLTRAEPRAGEQRSGAAAPRGELSGERDSLVEVGRVVALFLQYFHARIKPLIGVVLVVGDAGTEHVHQREALVLNGALEHFDHVFLLAAERARHVSGTANDCHRDRINRVLNASVRRALGFHSLDTRGRALAGS